MTLWENVFGQKLGGTITPGNPTGPEPTWGKWANDIDPLGERNDMLSILPKQYVYGQVDKDSPLSFTPVGNVGTGMVFDPISAIVGHESILQARGLWEQLNPIPQDFTGNVSGGKVGKTSGEYAPLNTYDSVFATAGAKWGISPNLIKAVAMVEHGWPETGTPVSEQGAQGIMQIMPSWMPQALQLGLGNYQDNTPAGHQSNILLGAWILAEGIKRWTAAGAVNPVAESVMDYLGRGGPDANGTTADVYWKAVNSNWTQLNESEPSAAAATNWERSFDLIFGSGQWQTPDWGSFGAESSAMCNGQPCYTYGTQYGLNGSQHTGIDVPLPLNTPLAAGFSGTVVCSRTGVGNGMDSCAAFQDDFGSGAGRIEIMSDDGNVVLIYGHSSKTAVQAGQHVNIGDLVGYSGGMNSLHTHLEARVKDPSMPSGWRLVDARTVLGGGSLTPTPGQVTDPGTGTGPIADPATPGSLLEAQQKAFYGMPAASGNQGWDFHTWLVQKLFGADVSGQVGG